jgi:predicted XRE-type DNA-binding protein
MKEDLFVFDDNLSDEELTKLLMDKVKKGEIIPDRMLIQPKSTPDLIKKRICMRVFSFYRKNESRLSKASYAEILTIQPGQLSHIIRYDHRKFSLDFMINVLEQLAKHDLEARIALSRLNTAI